MSENFLSGNENLESFDSFYHLSYLGDQETAEVVSHKHDFYEFLFFMHGDVEYQTGGKNYSLMYGDIIVIPPHTPHSAKISTEKSYRRYVLWLKKDFVDQLLEFDDSMQYLFTFMEREQTYRLQLSPKDIHKYIHYFSEIMESQLRTEFGHMTKRKAILYDIFYSLNKLLYQTQKNTIETEEQELQVQIANYIKNHLTEHLSLDLLAEHFFVSKYYMLHLFKEKMSVSIYKYILIRRLELGKALILSGESITKVHESCGFKDYVTFYRAFKKRYEMSPSVYYSENQRVYNKKN